jgi:hypothetical protein
VRYREPSLVWDGFHWSRPASCPTKGSGAMTSSCNLAVNFMRYTAPARVAAAQPRVVRSEVRMRSLMRVV